MATIPLYERRVSPSGTGSAPRASGADPVGAALGGLGQTIGNIGEDLARKQQEAQRKKEHEDALAFTNNAMTAARIAWIDRTQKSMEEAAPGAEGYTKSMLGDFDNFQRDQVASAPNEQSKQFLQQQLNSLKVSLYGGWSDFESKSSLNERNRIWGESADNIEALAARDPEQAKQALAESQATLRASENKQWAAAVYQKIESKATTAAVLGMIERDASGSLEALGRYFGIQAKQQAATATTSTAVSPEEEAKLRAQLGSAYDEVMGRTGPDTSTTMGILQAELANASEADKPALRREIARLQKQDPNALAAVKPEQAQELLESGKPDKTGNFFIDKLDPQTAWTMRNRAQTEVARVGSAQREVMNQRIANTQAMASNGVVDQAAPTEGELKAVYGETVGQIKYKNEVVPSLQLGAAVSQLQSASPAQTAAILAAAAPREGDANYAAQNEAYKHTLQAAQLVKKKLDEDPASYVTTTSDRVIAAKQAADAAGWTPETAAAYANETLAEQRRMGAKNPVILTKAAGESIVKAFTDPETGGVNSASIVSQLEQQWGAHWPQVYGQLARDFKLPPAALVIPNMTDPGAKERLARLSVEPDANLEKLVASGEPKDIKEKLFTALEPFWGTLSYQGGGEAAYEAVRSQAYKLALSYRSQGKSLGDAVTQAAGEVANNMYQFEATYRIPRRLPGGSTPEQVATGVSVFRKQGIEKLDLVPPLVDYPGMRPEDAKKQWTDAVKTNPVFVTNKDESGLLLYARTKSGNLAPVVSPTGQVQFSWQDLSGLAVGEAATAATAAAEARAAAARRLAGAVKRN